MPRSRMIKPEFWDDERLAKISLPGRLTYIALWNFCDDYGVTKANLLWLKSRIYPFDQKISYGQFGAWIDELIAIKRIYLFQCGDDSFFFLPNFLKHQVICRPSKVRYPAPPESILNEHSMSTQVSLKDETETERETETETETQTQCARARDYKYSETFDQFWTAYPKKVGKLHAQKAWNNQNGKRPPIEQIIAKISQLKKSDQWKTEGGRFIPHPATWINRGGWDDEAKTRVRAPKWEDYEKYKEEQRQLSARPDGTDPGV